MKLRDWGLLLVLAALWGASFLFIRVAVPTLRPFPLVLARVLIAGGLLLLYASLIRQQPDFRARWRQYLLLGLLNNAVPFTLISVASLNLTASFASILNATTPLFSAIVAAIWLKDRLSIRKLVGLAIGLTGVALVVGWSPIPLDTAGLLAISASLGAALSYGLASVYGKVAFKGAQPLHTAIGQLLGAGLLIAPLAVANPPTAAPTTTVILDVLGLALPCTALAYLIYFRLITSAGPVSAASVTMLVPFFGILWGAVFLGERIQVVQFIGLLVIIAGLVLVTGIQLRLMRPAPLVSPS